MRVEDIASILKDQLDKVQLATSAADVGTVAEVGDGIARISGLKGCVAAGSMVTRASWPSEATS